MKLKQRSVAPTGRKQMVVPFTEIKAEDTGTFSGYAAVFGNIDLGGDIVERGAFKEFVTNSEGRTVVLWQHRSPIGTASLRQDDKGLYVENGRLVMEDAQARAALAHMKAKSVEGMSIGYDVLPGGGEIMESGVRRLTALKLWEVSVVTWGMNPLAGVTSAKAAQLNTIREFEDFLRDEGGFSHAQAKLLASGGWSKLQQAREEPRVRDGSSGSGDDRVVRSVIEYLNSIELD